MVKTVVAGLVIAALIIMILFAYAQKHEEECRRGRLLKSFLPCGSVSHSI